MKKNIPSLVGRTILIGSLIGFLTSLVVARAEPAKMFFNVRDFGAVGDGTNLYSPAINKAIDAAAVAGNVTE
jgi:polygalacturonase